MNGLKVPEESIIETIKVVEEKKIGKKTINFRLKDWGVSRQRYWGCPIPMAYDKKGKVYPIPKENLPIKLPEKINLSYVIVVYNKIVGFIICSKKLIL